MLRCCLKLSKLPYITIYKLPVCVRPRRRRDILSLQVFGGNTVRKHKFAYTHSALAS